VLIPSAQAYRPKIRGAESEVVDRETEMKRSVKAALNKISPENLQIIASRIKQEANPKDVHELEKVIALIFSKALAEPHFCQTYADLVYFLKTEMPEFPAPDGAKPVTFKSTLLNVCQSEFENMPRTLCASEEDKEKYGKEESDFRMGVQKKRFLANMKFIGHLFLRQLLTTKIIASIVSDLMCCESSDFPEEHIVECICEFICAIGYTLEEMPAGKACITQVCGRMLDLKNRKTKDGKGVYSKRIQFNIQDVLDTRAAGWSRKTFKQTAKTKDEVRKEQELEIKQAAAGKVINTGAEFVVAGARPTYLVDPQAKDGMALGADWQEIPRSKKNSDRR